MAKAKYKYFVLKENNGSITVTEEMATCEPPNDIIFMDSASTKFAKLLDRPTSDASVAHIEIVDDGRENPLLVYAKYLPNTSVDNTSSLFLNNNGVPIKTIQDMDNYLQQTIGIGINNRYITHESLSDVNLMMGSLGTYNAKRLVSGINKYIDIFYSRIETKKAIRLLLREEYGFLAICKKESDEVRLDDIDKCLALVDDEYQIEFEKKDGRKLFPFFDGREDAKAFLDVAIKVLANCDHGKFTPTALIDLVDAVDEFCAKIDGLDNRKTRTEFIRYMEIFTSPKPLDLEQAVSRAAACADILSKAAKLYLKTDEDFYFLHHSKILFPRHFQVVPESEQEMLKIFAIGEKVILPIKYKHIQNNEIHSDSDIDEDEIPF